jgi:alanyl-tRNA synthetase
MNSKEIRQKYLDFFKSKNHSIIPSASLVPDNDPTVLFTTAGMHPLVPYLMGEDHPGGRRVANVQKCIRTTDIEDVGDNRHLTFFEMLGNWSFGDYFKREAIEWSWEFLTGKEWLSLDPNRLYVTVFMGNDDSPIDEESVSVWKEQFEQSGIIAEVCPFGEKISGNTKYRIFPLPAKDNWWGPAGETGPCGPCTEMFYDVRPQDGPLEDTFDEEVDKFRIMEIWNDVFMEFNKTIEGKYEKLSQHNVDTGMGLERTTAVLNAKTDAYDIDVFYPLFDKIEQLSGKKYGESPEITKSIRIIADHIKAATLIIGDDKAITPSNMNQGYVVRRLIRRSVRHGRSIGITEKIWTKELAKIIAHDYGEIYPELNKNIDFIIGQLSEEEEKFSKTLERGLREFEKITDSKPMNHKILSGKKAFDLYQTYGFPIEITRELSLEKGFEIDMEEYTKELESHAELSRTASAGMFKGGLADAGVETKRLHTTSHLLLASLRKVLGGHVHQKGSNITAERLRFDFSHPEKLTDEQKIEVENMVNDAINEKLSVIFEEISLDDAKKNGAEGVFESKYGEKVKVYRIGEGDNVFSYEICGGPHVENTSELGEFKILKEESSSAGVRRIKAVLSEK